MIAVSGLCVSDAAIIRLDDDQSRGLESARVQL
jgi:hypothetical protein